MLYKLRMSLKATYLSFSKFNRRTRVYEMAYVVSYLN
jgi:hypothetical protein